jgi:hypothetical protein
MKLQIENKYQIIVDKVYNTEVEFDFEKYIKDNDFTIEDNYDLETYIYEYIGDFQLLYNEGDVDHLLNFDFNDDITILNLEEILKEYSYLIHPKKELTCCERAAKDNYKYCPMCVTKIIY